VQSITDKVERLEERLQDAIKAQEAQGRKLLPWAGIIIAIISAVFTTGQAYFKIEAMQSEMIAMRQELARKDVLQGQIDMIEYRLSEIQNAAARNEAKMEQLLRAVK